jgi:hypothetical protein
MNTKKQVVFSFDSLTSHANKIRTLMGTEETLSLKEMTTNLEEANTEVENQEELLTQIVAALDNKASSSLKIESAANVFVDGENLIFQ